jgi:hypothetical protein
MNKIIHPIEPEELMAYLDGELTADRASAAAAHVGECAECQNFVAELRDVSQKLKAWQVEPLQSTTPPAIATALAEKRPESQNTLSIPGRMWREVLGQRWPTVAWAGALAAAVLVVFATVRFQGNANHRFSSVASSMPREDFSTHRPTAIAPVSPLSGRQRQQQEDSTRSFATDALSTSDREDKSEPSEPPVAGTSVPLRNGPMIIRTAQLSLITKEFDKARTNIEAILKRHRGYVGELRVGGNTGSGRSLTATLRVPADQLDATLTDVKTLGRVESESQSGQDTTSEYVDLQARLGNARNTEQRLTDLLRNRTGKLSDVLQVEQELDRVRGEIEQMEAEGKNMVNQVSYATLNATITEDYQAQLQVVPPSTSTRLSNAAVEGYRGMVDGVVSLALFLLSNGPSLLLWGAILFIPARVLWKKVRRSLAS